MRALLVAWVLVVSTATPVLSLATPARADDAPVTGSWTQLRASSSLPDLQASDGPALPVENGPAGVVAFSAVRWSRVADLTLARVDTTGPVSTPAVWACAATTWTTGDRQPWSARPTVDCSRHVVGVASGDRMTWRTSRLGSPVDVLLVPAPTDTSGFAISFGAPTVDSFTFASSGTPYSTPQPTLEPPPAAVVAPPAAFPVGVPPAALPSTVAVPPAVAAAPVVPVLPPAPVAPGAQPATLAATASQHPAWPGQLLLAFLSLLLVGRAVFPSRPLTAPRSLITGEQS